MLSPHFPPPAFGELPPAIDMFLLLSSGGVLLWLALLSAGMTACYVARAGAVAYHRQRSSPDRDRL
jgi:hypothetical protein